ncbi:GpE family phage tail protein [Paraburkholderia mimosarum]|nr:GpE family phage tail protein [Paraburkholderia mimosarum]
MTWFFHWGPRDAGALTWTELREWHSQAQRIGNLQAHRS